MNIDKYIEEMKRIQEGIINYLDYETNIEERYQNILENRYKLKSLLYLLLKISNNHYRDHDFFSKIERLFIFFKDEMKQYFSNSELFHIFKSNKRILLFLFEEKIMLMDEHIIKKIIQPRNSKYDQNDYLEYFTPEIKPFLNYNFTNSFCFSYGNARKLKRVLQDHFYENRKIGENEGFLYEIIRNDSIEDFIIYVNKNMYPLNSFIEHSIYETNSFLLKREHTTLIEYAVFFGSTQIFNYLRKNGVELTSSLCEYVIHGRSVEIINLLEENHIKLPLNRNKTDYFEYLLKESIKCHHIEVSNYILNNYLQNSTSLNTLTHGLKYYNFYFIQNNADVETLFFNLCKYDYYLPLVDILKEMDIDLNKTI